MYPSTSDEREMRDIKMKIKDTESLCPECLKKIPAEIYEEQGKVYIKKPASTMENGKTSTGATTSSINGLRDMRHPERSSATPAQRR